MTDVIIIGGGTAGLTAAVYVRRAGKTALVLEQESFGGQIVYSKLVENYPGVASVSGAAFADGLTEQAMALGAEVSICRALGIRDEGDTKIVVTEDGDMRCRAVVLAPGMKHRRLSVKGESELAGVSYCAVCDGAFYKGGTIAVVGGGNAALQDAVHLSSLCERVYLVHRRDAFRADETNVKRVMARENITPLMCQTVSEIMGEERVTAIRLRDQRDGKEQALPVDGVFVSVGFIPNTEAFRGAVALDAGGFVIAGEDCVTGMAGVFAAGDCRAKRVRQLTTAAADGAVAALGACEYIDSRRI